MQADDLTIAFVGAGNMAQSIMQGLLGTGLPATRLRAADPVPAARDAANELGVSAFTDNVAATADADVIVLAVKPQIAALVASGLNARADQLIVSIVAGIDLASLAAWAGPDRPIVRCMPNTPALVGAGMSALYANSQVSAGQKSQATYVLDAVGETVWVDDERALDAVTAVSGSGPAYFFMLMEAMIEAGTRLGLTEELARTLTLQTAYGAALMARDSKQAPAQLRKNVTSPGGTTERALNVMASSHLSEGIIDAVIAADARAAELAREFGVAS